MAVGMSDCNMMYRNGMNFTKKKNCYITALFDYEREANTGLQR